MKFRLAVLACALTPAIASANVEVGGFAGVHLFSDSNELGVVDQPHSPSEGNSFIGGLRVGVMFQDLIGIEAEFGVLPTNARVENNHYSLTDLTYRAHVILQFGGTDFDKKLVPFVLAGAGAFSIVSANNKSVQPNNYAEFIGHDTDPVEYMGAGVKYRISPKWGLRGDLRLLLPPSSTSTGVTTDFEFLISVYADFARHRPVTHDVTPPPPPPPVPVVVDDDPDKDGIKGDADKCPLDPEDKDGFQDADGCPDPDNDGDGILDKDDKCPNEPEVVNGFQDADGCPDDVPKPVVQFTGAIQGITFKVSSADLEPESNAILDKAVAVLVEYKDVKLEIQGHADDQPLTKGRKYADNMALSQARAETVKAYFVGKGIDAARLTPKGYGDTMPLEDTKALKGRNLKSARGKNRRVEFKLL
jgi:OOP family OmpA-OmpF porin